jgi:cell division protein FtsW (lipid II flippase)
MRILTAGLKLVFGLLIAVALYRVAQRIQQPEVLFQLFQASFLLLLAAWIARTGLRMLRGGASGLSDGRGAARTEAGLLAGVTLLVLTAFMLVGVSRELQEKVPALALPGLAGYGHHVQALAAASFYVLLLWLLHILMCRLIPLRDPWLFPLAGLICGLGLVFIYRLGPDIAAARKAAGFENLFKNQMVSLCASLGVFLGALTFLGGARIEALTRKRFIYALLSIVLILLTIAFGVEIHGRKLSLDLGVMNFQTVELVKILALLFMVGYFRYEMDYLELGKNRLGLPRARYLMPYLTMWVLTLLPIFIQKDLGPTALIFALFLVVFYLGTGSALSVLLGIFVMAAIGVAAYHAGVPSMVKTRVDMWLDPFHHSQNMAEALWAVSDGGLFGAGIGKGLGHMIPVVQSDFNFVAAAEELGVLGAGSILAAFGLLVWRVFQVARSTAIPYQQLLVAGVGTLWMIQTLVIVGGNVGLLPLTGITLPFVSYGGSSLLVNFLALGIVLSISANKSDRMKRNEE